MEMYAQQVVYELLFTMLLCLGASIWVMFPQVTSQNALNMCYRLTLVRNAWLIMALGWAYCLGLDQAPWKTWSLIGCSLVFAAILHGYRGILHSQHLTK